MRCTSIIAPVLLSLAGAAASVHAEVVIETVTVGNPGNVDDTEDEGYGGVDYVYQIGTFEVTAGQYTEFLNAVAATDTYGLYNPYMDSGIHGCQITRNGTSGSYTYDFSGGTDEAPGSTATDWGDRPANWVSWGDAARFANWLHNGQPTGAQDLTTTEDGSYYLNGVTSGAELMAVMRKPDATWVIPSEDEWYKAAYHKNDGVTGNYFDYPTSSDSVPGYVNDGGNLSGTGTAFTEGGTDPGNYATYNGDGGANGIGSPYYRTEVGEWENSESPYGTFDHGGNVWEWNEAVIVLNRGLRGGSFIDIADTDTLHAALRNWDSPSVESSIIGFRLADVSECGDGTIEGTEECDDSDTDDGDGCSSTCTVEDGWECIDEPSVCERVIPAVSEWGVVAMVLLVLTAGTVVFIRQRQVA